MIYWISDRLSEIPFLCAGPQNEYDRLSAARGRVADRGEAAPT